LIDFELPLGDARGNDEAMVGWYVTADEAVAWEGEDGVESFLIGGNPGVLLS
jgi:hypothetical protein